MRIKYFVIPIRIYKVRSKCIIKSVVYLLTKYLFKDAIYCNA